MLLLGNWDCGRRKWSLRSGRRALVLNTINGEVLAYLLILQHFRSMIQNRLVRDQDFFVLIPLVPWQSFWETCEATFKSSSPSMFVPIFASKFLRIICPYLQRRISRDFSTMMQLHIYYGVLILAVIVTYCTKDPVEHLCLHYREEAFIALSRWPAMESVDDYRAKR